MKIIITVNTYYPLKDGVQFVTHYHAENLALRGHNVIVFTTNHGNDSEEIHNGVKIIRFNVVNKWNACNSHRAKKKRGSSRRGL